MANHETTAAATPPTGAGDGGAVAGTPATAEPVVIPEDAVYDVDEPDVAELYKKAMEEMDALEEAGEIREGIARRSAPVKANNKRKREEVPSAEEMAKGKANPNIWISGLPKDIQEEEIAEHFHNCGVIKVDVTTGIPYVKLYLDEDGNCTGNALLTFYRVESVALAIEYKDDTDIRPGVRIRVEEAQWTKTNDAEDKHVDRKASKKKKVKKIFDQTRDLAWDDASARGTHLPTTVILKNMFTVKDFETPNFLDDLKADLEPEFRKYGNLKKVLVFDTHPDGVVSVKYEDHDSAMKCFQENQGRYFAGRRLTCEWWDGVTNYKVPESDEMREARLKSFGDFLEDE